MSYHHQTLRRAVWVDLQGLKIKIHIFSNIVCQGNSTPEKKDTATGAANARQILNAFFLKRAFFSKLRLRRASCLRTWPSLPPPAGRHAGGPGHCHPGAT
jgi:hypothetical protein